MSQSATGSDSGCQFRSNTSALAFQAPSNPTIFCPLNRNDDSVESPNKDKNFFPSGIDIFGWKTKRGAGEKRSTSSASPEKRSSRMRTSTRPRRTTTGLGAEDKSYSGRKDSSRL